jgi:hypothetical protein
MMVPRQVTASSLSKQPDPVTRLAATWLPQRNLYSKESSRLWTNHRTWLMMKREATHGPQRGTETKFASSCPLREFGQVFHLFQTYE